MSGLDIDAHGEDDFCYLTTIGRSSGQAHTIEIWFVAHEGCAYLMAGDGRSDWVRNLRHEPNVRLRIEDVEVPALAHVVEDRADPRQPLLRGRMADKYGEREGDGSLTGWAQRAVLVEVCPSDPPLA